MKNQSKLGTILIGLMVGTGCQGGLTGLPGFSNLNNPSRVPPPGVGSFQAPTNYSNSVNVDNPTAGNPSTPTLGQLRSMESGSVQQTRFTAANVAEFSMNDVSIAAKPKLADAIPSPRSSNSMNAVAQSASTVDLPVQPNGPAVVSASAMQPLPSSSGSQAATSSHASLSDAAEVRWRKP